jgi:hypothetical protein
MGINDRDYMRSRPDVDPDDWKRGGPAAPQVKLRNAVIKNGPLLKKIGKGVAVFVVVVWLLAIVLIYIA